MSSEDQSRIDELQKSLYSRNSPDVRSRRKLRFGDMVHGVKASWDRPAEDTSETPLNTNYEDHSMSFFTKLLIGSAIFCVIAVGIGGFLFFKGANFISGDNIDITVTGPVSVPGGAPVSFDIKVTNKNNVDLQLADLSVEFPAGATDPADPSRELTSYRELIGDIPAGGNAVKTVKAIIFGEENLQKQIVISVSYKVKGSSSLFTKERSYDIIINSSPLVLTAKSFDEISSGQEFEMDVELVSNSQEPLKNVLLNASYPFGFTFISSTVKPLPDNSTWRIGDIPAGGKRTIQIRGKLVGEDDDVRVFRFVAGAQSSRNQNAIGTEFMTVVQEITVTKPFMTVGINVDSQGGDEPAIGEFNRSSRVEVTWENNLPVAVTNAQISVKLSGSAYDKRSVSPEAGNFRSADDTITWDQRSVPDLASIAPGESGRVTFSVSAVDQSSPTRPVTNPQVSIAASISGRRTQESGVPQNLDTAATRQIKVSSALSLTPRVLRFTGPFTNTGPIPPRAENRTTYTVMLSVDSTANSASGAMVTAKLPSHVEWLDAVSPSSEDVRYDADTGVVTWNVGSVSAYSAVSGRTRQAFFQVALEPGVNLVGSEPALVDNIELTAIDDFTGEEFETRQQRLTTDFDSEPAYQRGMGTVSP
jgi:hypothetical protein